MKGLAVTVEEIMLHKENLERQIYLDTLDAIEDFRKKTGISPAGIDMRFVEITTLGSGPRQWILSEARVRVEL